jgi:hypothetical protein
MISCTVTLETDPTTGELVMPLPPDILAQVGWDIGDTLIWEDMKNGSWKLTKKEDKNAKIHIDR